MQMTNEQMSINVDLLASLPVSCRLGYAVARNLRKLRDAAATIR